jgi:ATP-dependent helicase/nuclease subunit A
MEFTQEQFDAIWMRDQNLIVTAGAGSGKTVVLVARFVALLEANPGWTLPELVAITFTEKAAREMRERVRKALRDRLAEVQDGEAIRHWQAQESLLDNARIGTIHSLCAQILRANPARVPVDPGFEVIDENEAHLLKSDAAERALVRLAEDAYPAAELLLIYGVGQVRAVLEHFASRSEAKKLADSLPGKPETLWQQWEHLWQERKVEALDFLRNDEPFWQNLDWSPPTGWASVPPDDKLMPSWNSVHAAREELQSDDFAIVINAFDALAAGIDLRGGAAGNWGGKEIVTETKAVLKGIRERAEDYVKVLPRPLDAVDEEAARLLFLWKEAVDVVGDIYHSLKDDRSALDFDDLESLTQTLLREHPAVAGRYASGVFKHVMVDEFQDTNALQREIVERICGEDGGRLFVVGDPKQSIYAFRGADVSVFHEQRDNIVNQGGHESLLSASFRSHRRLVEAFNDIFRHILAPEDPRIQQYEVPFEREMTASRGSEDFHNTPIHFICLEKPAELDRLSSDEFRRWEAYEIVEHLKAMKDSGVKVHGEDGYRPFDFGDVAILFQAMSNAPLYEEVFKRNGLPYVTIAGKGYYDRQEVWDALNLLRALHNHADDLALASVLRSPMYGLSDDALFALRLVRAEDGAQTLLWDALQADDLPFPVPEDDREALIFARESLNRLRELAGRVTVDSLLVAALDETAYDAILTALPDGDRRRGNLDKLMQVARQSGRIALGEFLAYMHDLTAVEPREGEAPVEGAGAVQLMSVHKSKGLEFPVVVIADATWTRRSGWVSTLLVDPQVGPATLIIDEAGERVEPFIYREAKALDYSRHRSERKRLLYVAATRARDFLLVSGRSSTKDSWMDWLKDALNINVAGEYHYEWGDVAVHYPAQPPHEDFLMAMPTPDVVGWDALATVTDSGGEIPRLAGPVPDIAPREDRHLSVTQLEDLGSISEYEPREAGRRRFRHSVLHDAPPPARPVSRDARAWASVQNRIVGTVVHRALQIGLDADQDDILRAYAWDENVTDPAHVDAVVQTAQQLLTRFKSHGEPETLRQANRILREIPFLHRINHRVIHGVIDVLYESEGVWYVLDYKTAPIPAEAVKRHARRYAIQLGAYANAVELRTGIAPIVQLYYLHPGVLEVIDESVWRKALDGLDGIVAEALHDKREKI